MTYTTFGKESEGIHMGLLIEVSTQSMFYLFLNSIINSKKSVIGEYGYLNRQMITSFESICPFSNMRNLTVEN